MEKCGEGRPSTGVVKRNRRGTTSSAMFSTSQESFIVDAWDVDTKPLDLALWSDIDGGKTSQAMNMPILGQDSNDCKLAMGIWFFRGIEVK